MEGWFTGFSASLTESHACQFLLDALALAVIAGFGEPVGEGEEPLFLAFLRLKPGLDQVHKNTIGAGLARFGDGAHMFGDPRRKRDALADGLL